MSCKEIYTKHLENLKVLYDGYFEALNKLKEKGVKEYTIGDRTFRYQDIGQLQKMFDDIVKQICKYDKALYGRSGVTIQRVVPIHDT